MKRMRWNAAAGLVACAAFVAVMAGCCAKAPTPPGPTKTGAADQKTPTTPAADPNVVSLFDGKTMGNWAVTDFGGQGDVDIKDGQMLIRVGGPLSGVTWKGEPPARINYEISLEAMRVDGSDFFCGLTVPVEKDAITLICGGWGGGVTGLSSLDGQDASENETTGYITYENGKWQKIKLQVLKGRIVAWVNGQRVINVNTTEKRIGVRIEVELSRPLGISTFATTGAIRNMTLKKLTDAEVKKAMDETAKE